MIKYTADQVVKAVQGKLISGEGNQILKGISTDTRNLKDEDIFIALRGSNFDAHDFLDQNVIKDLKAVIIDREIKNKAEVTIKVNDTTEALQDLARFHQKKNKDVKVIGITGSTGKTSTKDILYDILKQKYTVKKNEGNLNNQIGVPLTIFRMDGSEDYFIIEMGMSQLGEIKLLADITNPQIGIITNVGKSHIKQLKSVENIAKAKGELIHSLKSGDLAVLNYDNKFSKLFHNLGEEGIKYKYFGFGEGADYKIKDYEYMEKGMQFSLIYKNKKYKLSTNLYGEHNLYNIAAAVTVANQLDIDWKQIKSAVKEIKLSSLRSDIREIKGVKIINDSYNANPLSMQNALKLLNDIEGKRKIAILGDMLELGQIKEDEHRKIGKYIVKQSIDYLITTGKLAKLISKSAVENGMENESVKHFKDKKNISDYLLKNIKEDDVLLIKGSRGMKMETIFNNLIND